MLHSARLALARAVLSAAAPALAFSPGPSAAEVTDRITWVRSDGAPGWQASIPRDTRPAGGIAISLTAPTWFPRLPQLTLSLAAGGTLDLGTTRGRVVLLDFWASWCGPCLMELPHLQRLQVRESPRGLLAIAVNADEPAAVAAASAKRLGLTVPVALNDATLYRGFEIHTLPTVVVVDKQGRVRARWEGYRTGLENTISEAVAKLLADDPVGTQDEVASVLSGAGTLRATWSRDLSGSADGVAVLPAAAGDRLRVIAAGLGLIVAYDRRGELTSRTQAPTWAGRLLDLGATQGGGWEVVGYRRGATTLGVIDLRSGAARTIEAPAPLIGVAVAARPEGGGPRIVMATLAGPAMASVSGVVSLVGDKASARDIGARRNGGVLALAEDGSIASMAPAGTRWPTVTSGAERLVAALDDGVAVGPRTVIAAAAGRFLPGRSGSQLAVATHAGHVVLLDAKNGAVQFDAAWADVRDLAAGDLDGDGLDELIVAAGRRLTALSAGGSSAGAGGR